MMNFLAVYAFVRLVRVTNVKEWSDLASVFEMAIKPLLTFSISVLEMQHLIYAGCATPTGGTLHTEFTHFFQRHYATLFQRMVTPAEMQSCLGQTKQPWLNELFKSPVGESVAFRFASNAEFEKFLDSKKLHGEERSKYQRLFGQAFPSAAVSLKRLIAAIPSFQLLAEKWDRDCPLNNYHVTSVGRAIAQCRLLNLTRPNLEIVDDSPLFTSPQTF